LFGAVNPCWVHRGVDMVPINYIIVKVSKTGFVG
jgi:hypothetical protein